MNLASLSSLFADAGCRVLYAKPLAGNDNSKNQVYFAGAVEALNIFPSIEIFAENTSKGPSFKAKLKFGWLLESGQVSPAPHAQLILYAQYPEVRFSGFLRGCQDAPSDLMAPRARGKPRPEAVSRRLRGRVLFLGVTGDRRVLGFVAAGDSDVVAEFNSSGLGPTVAVFAEIPLPRVPNLIDTRNTLLTELGRIHRIGWIDSKQLDNRGNVRPCDAPQCGGFTLEAELGIAKNSESEPDFLGWEVKQYGVSNFNRPLSGRPITLMTPEPTGGIYQEQGVEAFVRRFGYPDRLGRGDRMNFGGVFRIGKRHALTGLTMQLAGYDTAKRKIVDADGGIRLLNDGGEVAAEWKFSSMLAHWSRKHTRAVYVPSVRRVDPRRQYAYGPRVRLAVGTNSLHLLAALAGGNVYYDPGIKVEHASTVPEIKRRSQFRVAARNIDSLYEDVSLVEV